MDCSEPLDIEGIRIRIRFQKDTMELFTIPVPSYQQEFAFENPTSVRILDNPLQDNLRNYVAWGRF
ncbi:MAG: hypothetical protein JRJ12_17425 [Deltaproteobacteria bacterium]|nr:hypothetical protein [Deltaproteobacteria bacterium]MBW2072845.1 hypothetical protein [Deltaproteobacteria bacterium]